MLRSKAVLGSLLMTFGIIAMVGGVVQAQSGNLEPPESAVDGSGDPVATTQTQPSWDQDLPANERFRLVLGGAAVLDKETGLVWEQSPSTTAGTWANIRFGCVRRNVGGKAGWRLPSVHELASLLDRSNSSPTLPTGHFFSNVQSDIYWSATTVVENSTSAWGMDFDDGDVGTVNKTNFSFFVWCVRGGGPLSEY